MMQNEFQPEENQTPQTAFLPVAQTMSVTETEAETQDVQVITKRLNAITTGATRAKRRFWIFYAVVVAFIAACFIATILFVIPLNPLFLPFLFAILPLELLAFALLFLNWSRQSPKFEADELARLGGVQAIPALLAAIGNPIQMKKKRAIYTTLTSLLPQMKASDAHLLTPAMRRTFHLYLANATMGVLSHARYDAFFVSILKALEQVGDASAIPVVARLAKMKGQTRRRKALRQAAQDCLPTLRANYGEVENALILLRASHSEDARPNTLLRPASASTATNPAELLRGANKPDTPE